MPRKLLEEMHSPSQLCYNMKVDGAWVYLVIFYIPNEIKGRSIKHPWPLQSYFLLLRCREAGSKALEWVPSLLSYAKGTHWVCGLTFPTTVNVAMSRHSVSEQRHTPNTSTVGGHWTQERPGEHSLLLNLAGIIITACFLEDKIATENK